MNNSIREFTVPFEILNKTLYTPMGRELQHVVGCVSDYYLWYGGIKPLPVKMVQEYSGQGIPLGTNEQVEDQMRIEGITPPSPLDIPPELDKYIGKREKNSKVIRLDSQTCRHVGDKLILYNTFQRCWHYKSLRKTKDEQRKIPYGQNVINPKFPCRIKPWFTFASEWRVFVYNGRVEACQHYQGDPLVFPCRYTIRDMIKEYKSAPPAYTLDVGVIYSGKRDTIIATLLIECHHFYGCGLYGFNSHIVLKMWADWWEWWKRNY
jgi:hypothetical protein